MLDNVHVHASAPAIYVCRQGLEVFMVCISDMCQQSECVNSNWIPWNLYSMGLFAYHMTP